MILTLDHAPVFTDMLKEWQIAKKTKNIRAKPAVSVMVDKAVLSKFLITTLEANEPLGDGSVICLGEAGDVWQQMPKKLIAKYNVTGIDADGWMICEPRPDNSIECIEWGNEIDTPTKEHFVKALWGEDFRTYGKCQRFAKGDYICRNRDDKTDVWVVRRKFFINTYSIISE
jgi:hypothetical protein